MHLDGYTKSGVLYAIKLRATNVLSVFHYRELQWDMEIRSIKRRNVYFCYSSREQFSLWIEMGECFLLNVNCYYF